ncbi:MAG: DUF917 domain-containing protein [Parcubacteria group bacterium]|nr:DUF917 domain-containing protein [Parcubacteria group bacterium]
MLHLEKKNLKSLLLGSLFFGTGGGLSYKDHKKIFSAALRNQQIIPIKKVGEFNKTDHLVSIYGVGDPSRKQPDFKKLILGALKEYTQTTGAAIKAVIPGEIGAEGLAFQAAVCAGLPVVDSDLVGGRAAPEIQMDTFTVHHLPITPVLVVGQRGNKLTLKGNVSAPRIEEKARRFVKKIGGAGVLIGYCIRAGDFKKICAPNTISLSLKIGALLQKRRISKVLQTLGGAIVSREKITRVGLTSKGGFLQGWVNFEHGALWIKNENILLTRGNKVIATAPDHIILLGKNGQPIHNTQIKKYKGRTVSIITLPASYYWVQEKNRKIWQTALPL